MWPQAVGEVQVGSGRVGLWQVWSQSWKRSERWYGDRSGGRGQELPEGKGTGRGGRAEVKLEGGQAARGKPPPRGPRLSLRAGAQGPVSGAQV